MFSFFFFASQKTKLNILRCFIHFFSANLFYSFCQQSQGLTLLHKKLRFFSVILMILNKFCDDLVKMRNQIYSQKGAKLAQEVIKSHTIGNFYLFLEDLQLHSKGKRKREKENFLFLLRSTKEVIIF